ncbi:hypothetical protein RHSIM_Rhsim10G0068100 [Rhododendron simsii]|uniref:Uncharacterized protein n=1 Tax=Rhododendron simsii TaxID=118357 RepID=A0A834GEV0_RHOSS|nr:hypothetical protein RHSIM_Rhsim10G0068100 [Rhododendron simsii]
MAATELRSEEPSLAASPRISFSHDLSQYDVVPVEPHPSRLNSTGVDFNFSVVREGPDHELFSADELFSDGKLLPSQIKTKPIIMIPPNETHQSETNPENPKTEDSRASEEKQSKTTSFWPFKRSCSVSGGGYGRGFCPLPLLSRSYSTGSAAASSSKTLKTTAFSRENWQRNLFSSSLSSSSSKSQGNTCCSGGNYWKPPVKKKGYGKAVRVNPVLNVPSGNLFGLGSIFSNGKDKNKKK